MRGLKGAVINNLYLMRCRSSAVYLMATVAVLLGYLIFRENTLLLLAQIAIFAVLPAAVLETAEASFVNRWNVFEKSWGISPALMVLSRYIIFIGISVLCAGIWLISPLHGLLYGAEYFIPLENLFAWGQLMCIVYFPLMYLLNPNKKSASAVILVVAMFGTAFLSFSVIETFSADNFLLTMAIIAGLYIVSVMLSVVFDKIHRGRAV